MQVVGQKYNLELINSWEKIPNFIIIKGDKNTGKTTLTFAICEKFNMHYVKMGNSVNDVRELVKLMTPKSNTVYHFKDFDKASLQAKNALLKITEETPEGNTIIITGNTQINTLESRARKIIMSAYTLDEMMEYMKKSIISSEVQQKLYMAGINTPSKFEKYYTYEKLEDLLNYAFYIYNRITMLEYMDCISLIMSFKPKKKEEAEVLDVELLFMTMLIHIIEYNIVNKQKYDYYSILNILISAKESIERDYTLNKKFILFRAFTSIKELRGNICEN